MADIPLINDYDFSDLSDKDLDIELEITQAILDQIDRMIAENERQITLENDVINRRKLITILTNEIDFKTDKKNALLAEKASRSGS